jgi:RNA polymerase sigma-70 factor (ECF subfamily)
VEDLVPQLKKQDRRIQKELFERVSSKMLGVCRSYTGDLHHAEDCMLKAFVKVFKNIESYESKGSFEGWIRRIMVNECLDFLKLNKSFVYREDSDWEEEMDFEQDLIGFDAQDLLDRLPENYRVVFNLFVLEEYSHKEIAESLKISESASRTQFARAKKKMKELIFQQKNIANEN